MSTGIDKNILSGNMLSLSIYFTKESVKQKVMAKNNKKSQRKITIGKMISIKLVKGCLTILSYVNSTQQEYC